ERVNKSVHLGGVEEVDAGVEGGVEEAQRLRQPALLPHRHRPLNPPTRRVSTERQERGREGFWGRRQTEAEAGDGKVRGEVE
uniref:Uncharacterized protein n=1 Tax=Oryza brachyantha TaxID=4533 RepID=J3N9V6_ORYBR